MRALVFENQVVDVQEKDFEVHSSMTWHDAPEGCELGWKVIDGVITAPPKPTTEELLNTIRVTRDNLLRRSDWRALQDSPAMSDEWKAYRQALRDLPATTKDPANPIYPTKPE